MSTATRNGWQSSLPPSDLVHVRRILENDLEASVREAGQAVTLPPDCYTDRPFFEFEKDAIFYREWLCVGRTEQLKKPGDYFSVTIVDEPVIVVMREGGEIHAMSAVCRHRGNVITGPSEIDPERAHEATNDRSGNCDNFKCIYHDWMYDLEGRLINAPDMDKTQGFEPSRIRLPQFLTEIWNGFIFVNFDRDATPLNAQLSAVTESLENFHMGELVTVEPFSVELPWNWKVMQENSIEGYHTDHLHKGFEKPYPSSNVLPAVADEAGILQEIASTMKDFSFNPTFKAVLPVIETLSDRDRQVSKFALIPPTLLIGTLTDCAFYRIVHPLGPDRIRIDYALLVPRTSLRPRARREIQKMSSHGAVIIARHDAAVNSNVQKGLKSRFAERGSYSWQEGPLPLFNRWLVQRYTSGLEALEGALGATTGAADGRQKEPVARPA